jgi:hypothetical protein
MAARRLVNLLQRAQPPRDAVRVTLASIAALVRIGEIPSARPARWTSLFSHPALAPVVPKKPVPSLL